MCPYCHHPKSRVLATENFESFIRRRRLCFNCGAKFRTSEEYSGTIAPPPEMQFPIVRKIPEEKI